MKTILERKHMSSISFLLAFTILFLGVSQSFATNDFTVNDSSIEVIESHFNESGDGYEIIKDSLGTVYYYFIKENVRGVLTNFENGEVKLTYSDTPYEEDIVSVKDFQIDEEDIIRNNITSIDNLNSLNIDNLIEDVELNLLDEKHYDLSEPISTRNVTNSEANELIKDYMVRQGFPKYEEWNRVMMTQTKGSVKATLYRSQSYYTRKVKTLDVVPGMAVSVIVTILGFSFSSVLGVISTIMSGSELVSSVRDVLNSYLTDFEGLKEVYRSDTTGRIMYTAWSGQAKGIIAGTRKESFELNYSRKHSDYDYNDYDLLSLAW